MVRLRQLFYGCTHFLRHVPRVINRKLFYGCTRSTSYQPSEICFHPSSLVSIYPIPSYPSTPFAVTPLPAPGSRLSFADFVCDISLPDWSKAVTIMSRLTCSHNRLVEWWMYLSVLNSLATRCLRPRRVVSFPSFALLQTFHFTSMTGERLAILGMHVCF